jgi:aminoglycoside phosphotransferase (APT) family kinase protein
MNLEIVLSDIGVHSITSCTEILGGEDSSVWRVETSHGATYALRLLPWQRHQQFIREQTIIGLAFDHGIPVPKVLSVKLCGEWSTMLMEWAPGRTLVSELMERPDNANRLGVEFGRVQAAIHRIPVPESVDNETKNWLTPETDAEIEIIQRTAFVKGDKQGVLVHLDFHPLNVLTDGQTITAVIDWANAAKGDPRFDIARTMSILRLEGLRPGSILENFQEAIIDFERGWLQGYEQTAGQLGPLSIFNAWAGLRMIRDLSGKRREDDFSRMRRWVEDWLRDAESNT